MLGHGAACFLVCSCLLLCITCSACAGNLKNQQTDGDELVDLMLCARVCAVCHLFCAWLAG